MKSKSAKPKPKKGIGVVYKNKYKNKDFDSIPESTKDAKVFARLLRLIKVLINEHFITSLNRSKVLDTLGKLVECFDKQLKRAGMETAINQGNRKTISELSIDEDESIHWVFAELEENLLLNELYDDMIFEGNIPLLNSPELNIEDYNQPPLYDNRQDI